MNQRRESNFSIKTANRALMTGYRDGGSSSARRKSSASSQGHQSPPFFPHRDDFDIIGVVPGFEKIVEAESSKNKGKLKAADSVASPEDETLKEHKPAKRKKTEKDSVDGATVKGRRRSSAPVGTLAGGDSSLTLKSPSPSSPPSSLVPASRVSPPTAGSSFSRLKHINGFRNASSSSSDKSARSPPSSWPQMPLSCVRVWPKAEFTAAGMMVQFSTDRLSITIRRNTTKIPHTELKFVNYYTASTFKIFQFATHGRLFESSILARHYDPGEESESSPVITLFIDTSSSGIASVCAALKQKGVETKRLTSDEAEKILATKNRRSSNSRPQDQPDETLFVYPFNSSVKSKSIAVRAEDVSRLEDGEFLNDTLIEFGLKYAQANAEIKNAALAGQVYIFNSFFYQRFVSKPGKGISNSYEAIKSWTAKVDLFSMKYIIVPINENLHWYLAIITNPGLLLKKAGSTLPIVSDNAPEHKNGKSQDSMDIVTVEESLVQEETTAANMEIVKESRSSHIDADEKPYILCLDSLGGSHSSVFSVLRSYLQQELLSRKGIAMNLTSKEITGKFSSKCPKQDNLWDCGVYLLHFTEVFLRNPAALTDAIVNRADDKALWSLPEIASKRAKYKDIVIALTEQYRVYRFQRDLLDNIKGGKSSEAPSFASTSSVSGSKGNRTALTPVSEDDHANSKRMRDFLHRLYPYQSIKLLLQRSRFSPVTRTTAASAWSVEEEHASQEIPFDPAKTRAQLVALFQGLKDVVSTTSTTASSSSSSRSEDWPSREPTNDISHMRRSVLQKQLGFHLEIGPSRIPNAGLGVFLRNNSRSGVDGGQTTESGSVVAMYPGTLYQPGEAIFFNSINNRYILKCNDGIYVDGKANGLSGSIFRSVNGRDNYPGITASADTTWMVDWKKASDAQQQYQETQQRVSTGSLRNPLSVGQIINNGTKKFPPNVRYQELDVRTKTFPLVVQELLPNIWYSDDWHAHDHASKTNAAEDRYADWSHQSSSNLDYLRTVVLVTTRPVQDGEELYSTYIET
ncbi:hypothetical protein BGZ98_008401 [Dissophora globulifera]|nr:hypothetical protein BGZ98_008401 [Dissophora globulifera]